MASPLPFRTVTEETDSGLSIKIAHAKNGVVAILKNASGEKEANAKFIVRACNAHDDLVTTAAHALEVIQKVYSDGEKIDVLGSAIEPLIETLAKAKAGA